MFTQHKIITSICALPLWLRLALACLAGALMPYAFSPHEFKWLAILAMAAWIWLFMRGQPLATGFAFGLGWFGFGAWWLVETFHVYGPVHYALAVPAVGLLGMLLALFPALLAWLSFRLAGRGAWILAAFPCLAVAIEWLRGWLFTGLPWTSLGNLLLDTPAIGWVAYIGVYGAALLPAALAASVYLLIDRRPWRIGAAGLACAVLVTALTPSPYRAEGDNYRVALVQANIPQDVKWDAGFVRETMRRYVQASQWASSRSDVIVWPEAAVPFFLSKATGWDAWLTEKMRAWGVTVLFGGLQLQADGRMAHNGLFLFQPGSNSRGFAGKQHLVPFGEYVPSWIPFLSALVPNIADFKPAQGTGILPAGEVRYGSLVCYEAIFPEEAKKRVQKGAQVLVNITNDAWYGHSPAAWQHLQSARMRSVETGRYMLRAANTGVSAIIAPDGSITATTPWFTQSVVLGSYRLSGVMTPYQRWGDLPLVLLFLPVMLAAWCSRGA